MTLGETPAKSPEAPFSAKTNLRRSLIAPQPINNKKPTSSSLESPNWPQKIQPERKRINSILNQESRSFYDELQKPWPAWSWSWPHPRAWSNQRPRPQQPHRIVRPPFTASFRNVFHHLKSQYSLFFFYNIDKDYWILAMQGAKQICCADIDIKINRAP